MLSPEQQYGPYVLLTAAYNEEAYIEGAIRSVVAQRLLPRRWVIVSDDSTDRTDEIVKSYVAKYDFIKFLRVSKNSGHNFGAKLVALRKGMRFLADVEYEYIGNLDADVCLESGYFQVLIDHFRGHANLGIASGFVHEDDGSGFRSRWFNTVANVPHAAQLVRRECFQAVGGYAVLKYGGEDWYAQTCAKMKGWHVESIPDLKVFHNRWTGASSHPISNAFRLGRLEFSLGCDPLFEVAKCLKKMRDRPYGLGGVIRFLGFVWCYVSGERLGVPRDFADFLRREQRARLFPFLYRRIREIPSANSSRQIP
jgi:poly-beta-1,6-N-acetyl-D-glucosamine synthase